MSETWCNVNNEMCLNISGYNCILVNRKTSTGGGVALFILNNLNFDVCADLNAFANDYFECVFVKLSSSTFKTKILDRFTGRQIAILIYLCRASNLS